MVFQSLFIGLFFSLITFVSFGQVSAVHSSFSTTNLCADQTGTITFSQTGNFGSSDSIFVILPNTTEVSSNSILFSSGSFSQTNDTLILYGLPSVSSVDLTYTLSVNCAAFDVNTYSLSVPYSFALNSGSWTTQSTNSFNISSPVLNFIGGDQLYFNNAFLGQGVTRAFYYTNSNSSVPFNGVVRFCDTLPHSLSTTAVILDSVYSNSSYSSLLNYQISDSIVEITVYVSNLQQGDTLIISDIAYLNDCVVLQNNQTRFTLNYGCEENDLCQTVSNNNVTFNTSLNFDPNDKPLGSSFILTDDHHEACYSDTVVRTVAVINQGQGNATGIKVYFENAELDFGLSYLDTNSVQIYLNQIIPSNLNPYTTYTTTPTSGNSMTFGILTDQYIAPGDTVYIVYTEINKCLSSSDYVNYVNNTIMTHSIIVGADFLHPCFPDYINRTGSKFHGYRLNQQFNNLVGTVGDSIEEWFEIKNLSDVFFGNGLVGTSLNGIAYDLNNSLLEVELLLESGLSLVDTDSLLFCSSYGGINSFLTLEDIDILYGPVGPNQFDTVRATFNLPSTFQEANNSINSTTPPAHYPFKKASDFYQFFANSSIKFKLLASCANVAGDSKAIIKENIFFHIDTNCTTCKLPLASVEDEISILCPGCVLPGWNLTQFNLQRKNIGYEDQNNDHFPDSFPLQIATVGNINSQSVIIGDTLLFDIEGFISDGDPTPGIGFSFDSLGIVFDEGQFLFKGDVEKLQFIGAIGTFIQGNTSSPFTVPPSAATAYPGGFGTQAAIGINMSIDSLNSYGVSISSYNDSCSIIFQPKFKVVDNFDDGLGANPYFDLKNITAFYLMGGTPFDAPDILDDANIIPIDTIALMSTSERDSLSYWCVGYDGRYLGVGVDDYFSAAALTRNNLNATASLPGCTYRVSQEMAGVIGSNFLPSATGNGPYGQNPNSTMASAFEFELRDLYNLDSVIINFPTNLEVYQVEISTNSHYLDSTSFTSNWSTPVLINNSSLFINNIASATLYPEQFVHTDTNYTQGNNFLTYDENVNIKIDVYLKNSYCPNDSIVIIPELYIENYFSNFPGALNGDTVITNLITYQNPSGGVGINNEFYQPKPKFLISSNQIPPVNNNNVGFEVDISLEITTSAPTPQINDLINGNINIAYNSFVLFESPNGNFSNINVPIVENISTNYNTNSSYSSISTPSYVDTLNGNLLIGLETLGGRTSDRKSKILDLYANHDCSSVPPGGIDSLYLIYGWNCFDYPDTLENACFVDTFVLSITMPNTGLNVDYGIQDSPSLCDTLNFTATFDPTGFGEVSDVTIEVLNPTNSGINYVANSAYLNYDVSNTQVEPTTSINSYEWMLDSTNAGLYNFNELSPSATFTADFLTYCGITDDTVFILMSGTNYCGQIIYQDTFEITPQVYYDLPNLDALSVVASVDPFLSCSDTNTVSVSVNNIGGSASNTYNQLQIVLPSGYDYVTGGSPSYNSNDTLIFDLSTSIATSGTLVLPFDVVKTDSSCKKQFISAQVLLNSPYYCDTNQCFYSSATSSLNIAILQVDPGGLTLGTIDPTSLCSGMNEITFNFSSLGSGALEVFDANSNTILGQGNYSNTNGSVSQITIALSDTTSSLFVVNSSPCCPDTTYYTFDCDTLCIVNADFFIQDTICSSDSLTCIFPIVIDTSYSHHWIFEEGGFSFHNYTSSPCYNFGSDGTVTITHIVSAPCGSDTVTQTVSVIHFDNSISINLIGQNPLCLGDSLLLTPSSPVISIEWHDENGVFIGNQDSLYIYSAGVYSATITDSNGCVRIIPTSIFETQQPIVVASGNNTICSGDSVLISASGANNYQWDNGLGTVSSAYVSPSTTTTYTVIGTSSGCSSSDQLTITVLPAYSLSQSYSICPNDSVTVGTSSYNTDGIYVDTLVATNGCDSIVTTSITVFSDSSSIDSLNFCQGDSVLVFGTWYYQTATDVFTTTTANGCNQTITTVITFHPGDSITQYITICEDSSITVLGNVYDSTGVYTDVTQNVYGCDSTIITDLTVLEAPSVSFDVTPPDTVCFTDAPYEIVGNPTGGTLSGSGVSGNYFYPDSAGVGTHVITYTFIDGDTGCEGSSSITIVVEKCAGVSENRMEGVSLHPNPNKGKFEISGLPIGANFEIIDSKGRIIKTGVIQSENEEIDLHGVETGVYYLYATKNGVRGSINFVIME